MTRHMRPDPFFAKSFKEDTTAIPGDNIMALHSTPGKPDPVTAVIPAYNEEKRIGNVLAVLSQMESFSQILVVDDGSQDDTAAVVLAFNRSDARVQLLRLSANCGKGGAMVAGAEASRHDLVLFLDADLIGLRLAHIERLLEPVQNGRCQMALAHFHNGRHMTDWAHYFFPHLSGQRCLRWSLFRDTPDIDNARWSIEVALSFHAWANDYKVASVAWPAVTHTMRTAKLNWWRGTWTHAQMWSDIGKYLAKQLLDQGKRPITVQQRWN
jgi:glycosyltransferase involved in cell wall biosynthesis